MSVTADHCLAQLTSDLSDCCTTLSGLKTDGGFIWASGWPFPSHSLEPQYAPLIGRGLEWEEEQRSHCGLEWVQGCMGSGDRSQDMGLGTLGARGSTGWAWEGCYDWELSSTVVTPSCPFFPQSTQLQPRQGAASLLEPRCAWRVGHVWLCQL